MNYLLGLILILIFIGITSLKFTINNLEILEPKLYKI